MRNGVYVPNCGGESPVQRRQSEIEAVVENVSRVGLDPDALVDATDLPPGTDKGRPASRSTGRVDVEGLDDIAVRVGQQVEVETTVIGKLAVRPDVVGRDAVDGNAGLAVSVERRLELLGLGRGGCAVTRRELQHCRVGDGRRHPWHRPTRCENHSRRSPRSLQGAYGSRYLDIRPFGVALVDDVDGRGMDGVDTEVGQVVEQLLQFPEWIGSLVHTKQYG